MEEPYVQIRVCLQICLHLDDRTFTYKWQDHFIEVTTTNQQSTDETWYGSGKNIEVTSDVFSHFRFTVLTMKIPHTKTITDLGEITDKYGKIFFESLNRFIECCRIILGRKGLYIYDDWSDFRNIQTAIIGLESFENQFVAPTFFKESLRMGLIPTRSEEAHEKLQEFLNTEISLHQKFMADAKFFSYHNNAIRALLSAVTALEVKVSNTIAQIAHKKGISNEVIDKFNYADSSDKIQMVVRLMIPKDLIPTDAKPSEKKIFQECQGAITIRNKIVHEGLRDISVKEVKQWISYIEKLIELCEKLSYE